MESITCSRVQPAALDTYWNDWMSSATNLQLKKATSLDNNLITAVQLKLLAHPMTCNCSCEGHWNWSFNHVSGRGLTESDAVAKNTHTQLHNVVLRHPVAHHLFALSYPLCHMQTCVKILKFTIFRIFKLFLTSLMHYTFQPIRFIGDVKNNLKFKSEF
jgi:hypothetical protein